MGESLGGPPPEPKQGFLRGFFNKKETVTASTTPDVIPKIVDTSVDEKEKEESPEEKQALEIAESIHQQIAIAAKEEGTRINILKAWDIAMQQHQRPMEGIQDNIALMIQEISDQGVIYILGTSGLIRVSTYDGEVVDGASRLNINKVELPIL